MSLSPLRGAGDPPAHFPSRPGRSLLGAAVLAAILSLAGCGYRLATKEGSLAGGARSLYVPLFKNQTAEPGVEAWFTSSLREELALARLEGGEAADAVAEGEVVDVTVLPVAVGTGVRRPNEAMGLRVSSYRLQATVLVRVKKGGQTVQEVRVTGVEDYLPACTANGCGDIVPSAAAILQDEASRRLALRRLSGRLMRQAFEQLTAGF